MDTSVNVLREKNKKENLWLPVEKFIKFKKNAEKNACNKGIYPHKKVLLLPKKLKFHVQAVPKNLHLIIFWRKFFENFFFQNDSLGVFLCEKSIVRIKKP
jgi:hypothetical protein